MTVDFCDPRGRSLRCTESTVTEFGVTPDYSNTRGELMNGTSLSLFVSSNSLKMFDFDLKTLLNMFIEPIKVSVTVVVFL